MKMKVNKVNMSLAVWPKSTNRDGLLIELIK